MDTITAPSRQPADRGPRAAALAAAIAATLAAGVADAEIRFEPFVNAGLIYSDNVTLAPQGLEQDDLILELNPGFRATRDGVRWNAALDYELDAFFYDPDDEFNQTLHTADVTLGLVPVLERLFVDATGSYGQALIDPRAPVPLSNVVVSENRTDYWSGEVAPRWRQPIGSQAEMVARYSFGVVRYPEGQIGDLLQIDLDRSIAGVTIGSTRQASRLIWSVGYEEQTAEYRDSNEYRFDRGVAELGVPIGSALYLMLRGGEETDLTVNTGNGGLDESFEEVGLRWTPNERDRFEARVGHRFYGDSYFLDWLATGPRTTINVQYTEDPSTIGIGELQPSQLPTFRELPGPEYDVSLLTNDLFIDKTLLGAVTWRARRTSFELSARDTRRTFIQDDGRERESSASAVWRLRLGPRTEVFADLYGSELLLRTETDPFRLWQLALGVERALGPQTLLGLAVRHTKREPTGDTTAVGIGEYEESAVTLRLRRVFGRGGAQAAGEGGPTQP